MIFKTEELDNEKKLATKTKNNEFIEPYTEKINTISIKSKVNPGKDMTLNMAISENAGEKFSQQKEELLASLFVTVINEFLTSSIINLETLFLRLSHY